MQNDMSIKSFRLFLPFGNANLSNFHQGESASIQVKIWFSPMSAFFLPCKPLCRGIPFFKKIRTGQIHPNPNSVQHGSENYLASGAGAMIRVSCYCGPDNSHLWRIELLKNLFCQTVFHAFEIERPFAEKTLRNTPSNHFQ